MVRKLARENGSVPVAFGVGGPRFPRLGVHPELDPAGFLKKVTSRGGPGEYEVGFTKCITKPNVDSTWTRMAELEEFSKFLGFRNAPILEAREFQKTHRGPGTYNIPDDIDKPKSCSVVENKGFTTERRFSSHKKGHAPPPDSYFRNIFAPPPKSKKTFGRTPAFEWDGLVPRFKDEEPSFRKPPNLYNVVDPKSLEALMSKVVSTKGPYNLFTGKRDGSSIKNHFSPPCMVAPDRFHLEASDIDKMLHHPMKRRYGKFLQEERFPKKPTARMLISDLTMCYRDPKEPGPGYYDPSREYSFKPVKPDVHPFGVSIDQRPLVPWTIHPGPGRYYIKTQRCKEKHKPSWIFLVKSGRSFFKPTEKYAEF